MDTWNEAYRRRLILILAGYLALTIASTIATPLLRGPDEPAHIIYVRSLAHLRFPELAHTETRNLRDAASHEAHQPPLYYVLAAGPFRLAERLTGSITLAVRAARAVSVLLGLIWIYLIACLAESFFGKSTKALWATAFAAFIPMSTYIAGVVNNDIMICVTFTWALAILTTAVKKRTLGRRESIWLGAAAGLAILSKAQGLVLPLLMIFAVLLAWPRERTARSQLLAHAALALVTAGVVSSWWPIRNQIVYGRPLLQSLHHPVLTTSMFVTDISSALSLVSSVTKLLFQYFWAPFWVVDQWAPIAPRLFTILRSTYLAVTVTGTAVGMIGLLKLMLVPAKKGTSNTDSRVYALFLAGLALIYLPVVYQTLFIDRGVLQQGRLFLPMAGAVGIVFVQGYTALLQKHAATKTAAVLGITALVVLNLAFSYAVYYNYKYVEVGAAVTSSRLNNLNCVSPTERLLVKVSLNCYNWYIQDEQYCGRDI